MTERQLPEPPPERRPRPATAENVFVQGPVNGMGEPDLSGPYLIFGVSLKWPGGDPMVQRWKVSIGAAEVLLAELNAMIGDNP